LRDRARRALATDAGCGRSTGGHRLYTGDDLARLYWISLLRRLGFGLEQIAGILDDPGWQLPAAVRRHLDDLTHRIDVAVALRARLAALAEQLSHRSPAPSELFTVLEEMTMLDPTVHTTTALLVYDDLAAAHNYLVQVLGLTAGPIHRDEHGRVVHAEVCAGNQVIRLHPPGEDYKSPRLLGATTGMSVIVVDDVDAHHPRTAAAGADVVAEPTDQPYGVREYGVRDPEGHLWYFDTPLS
jgi:uncharacterized glyoxalase superfamily protein PhnB/DNA-binding transcriptional MerR regulator